MLPLPRFRTYIFVTAFAALAVATGRPQTAAAQGERLTGAEIRAQVTNKPFSYRSMRATVGDPYNPSGFTQRRDGGHLLIRGLLRADNSATYTCRNVTPGGENPCRGGGGVDGREVGVWSIESDTLCWQWLTARGGGKQCYELYRAPGGLRFKQVSGPLSGIDGETAKFE